MKTKDLLNLNIKKDRLLLAGYLVWVVINIYMLYLSHTFYAYGPDNYKKEYFYPYTYFRYGFKYDDWGPPGNLYHWIERPNADQSL